jgi:hypothetical protein
MIPSDEDRRPPRARILLFSNDWRTRRVSGLPWLPFVAAVVEVKTPGHPASVVAGGTSTR